MDLKEALQRLERPGKLSEQDGQRFLDHFPLDTIYRAVAANEVSAQEVAACLERILETGIRPPGLLDLSFLALKSPEPALRKLAAQQIGRLVVADDQVTGNQLIGELADKLLALVEDKDLAVAKAASQALLLIATQQCDVLTQWLASRADTLQMLTQSSAPVIRIRAISLIVDLAASAPSIAAAVQSSGLLIGLSKEIERTDDVLGCASAIQLVVELSQRLGAKALQVLGDHMVESLQSVARCNDEFLRCEALQALGALSAAQLSEGQSLSKLGAPAGGTLAKLLTLLQASSSAEADEVNAALSAVQQVAASAYGRRSICEDHELLKELAKRCFTTEGPVSSAAPAAHCMADLLGARAAAEGEATCLDRDTEQRVQEALYSVCGLQTPADVIWSKFRQPVGDVRIALYRLCLGLALRQWGAREICSHSELLEHLCNPRTESTPTACHSRYNALKALHQTATAEQTDNLHDALTQTISKLQQALKEGPYGGHGHAAPVVDTAQI